MPPRSVAAFVLQFDPALLRRYAARYSYPAEGRIVDEIGPTARERGWYTKGEFIEICTWKSPRSASRAARLNSAASIEEITRVALSATAEELRIWAPQALSFVSWPTASVLLHFGHRERYPILDYRALESLGERRPAAYSMPFWLEYLEATRRLAIENNVDMRTLDRALWQWSTEHGTVRSDGDERAPG
jgi:hypothetical protein